MNILESAQRQIGEDLASQATRADYQDLAFASKEIFHLYRNASNVAIQKLQKVQPTHLVTGKEAWVGAWTRLLEDLINMVVTTFPITGRDGSGHGIFYVVYMS